VDLTGWVGVGLGGNCDCRCGILYAPMLGWVVSLTSSSYPSPYSSELFVYTQQHTMGIAHLRISSSNVNSRNIEVGNNWWNGYTQVTPERYCYITKAVY